MDKIKYGLMNPISAAPKPAGYSPAGPAMKISVVYRKLRCSAGNIAKMLPARTRLGIIPRVLRPLPQGNMSLRERSHDELKNRSKAVRSC